MARVFITGSADGLGRAAAQTLLDDGHEVVIHARNTDRLAAVRDLVDRGAAAVVGDLAEFEQTRGLAGQLNDLGRMDAVIHNAGVYTGPHVIPVNIVAPYVLTALMDRPQRLVYLSSSDHRSGRARLTGVDWSGRTTGSYPDSKLFVTTLAAAVTRIWADVFSNAVDPGWVPTRMGGRAAPDDLRLGHLTQEWLAISEDPDARTSGGYWHHQRRIEPHPAVRDQRSRTNCSTTWLASPARASPEADERDVLSSTRGIRARHRAPGARTACLTRGPRAPDGRSRGLRAP
jgi:NAD(P)-dependent dehydrogenase (short-subunit alcohol dehydrogenase family)